MRTTYTAYAVLYGKREGRRSENFLRPVEPDGPMPLNYYVWLLRASNHVVLVDTGFSVETAQRRHLQRLRDPIEALGALGIAKGDIHDLILTHLHDDHAGNVVGVPHAKIHLQQDEMNYATGGYMSNPFCGGDYSPEDIKFLVDCAYGGRIAFGAGDAQLSPEISLHLLGGHTGGLQCVRVWTERGWLVLASDATHFYENMETENPFRQVIDVRRALDGYKTLRRLADAPELIVPGHDPAVMERFPRSAADYIVQLA